MRSRVLSLAAALGAAVTVGCSGEAVVLAQIDNQETGETAPLSELPVRFIPFDRDAVFDSLKNLADRPEPEAPDSLVQLQTRIQEAQATLSTATDHWNGARDSLRGIKSRLDKLPRSSAQYRLLFRDYDEQADRETSAKREMDAAFKRFNDLQTSYTTMAQEYALLHEQWADEAYADVDAALAASADAVGRVDVSDTTDMNGIVREKLKKGKWWVHARYELVYEELYWNVPIEVMGGDPVELILNRANAQHRPKY